jgi:hypothetical protein
LFYDLFDLLSQCELTEKKKLPFCEQFAKFYDMCRHTIMENPVDLYRSVGPSELLTKFKFNNSFETVTLEQLIQNVPPKLLGSFKLAEDRKEVDLLSSAGTVMETISGSFRPETCTLRRLNDGGLFCFNEEAHLSNLEQLPPDGDTPVNTDRWYFLEAAAIRDNATLLEYLTEEPDSRYVKYNGQTSSVFLYFKLAAGIRFPAGFESYFDNDPPGRWTIRRNDFDPFEASYCQIGGGFPYGMVPDLVNMGWTFLGLKLRAAAELADFNASFDKDTWTLAAIIHMYFSCLSTEELVNDAVTVLSDMSLEGYARESCSRPIIAKVLKRVLDDLLMYCSEQEFQTVDRFKRVTKLL